MEVGGPCFAHVRSYPWWPAKLVKISASNSKLKKDVFHVVFYGTSETASLPLKELAVISPDHIAKFSSPNSLKRKFFREGLKQMKAEFPWIPMTSITLTDRSSNTPIGPSSPVKKFVNTGASVRKVVKATPIRKGVKVGPLRKVSKDIPAKDSDKNVTKSTPLAVKLDSQEYKLLA